MIILRSKFYSSKKKDEDDEKSEKKKNRRKKLAIAGGIGGALLTNEGLTLISEKKLKDSRKIERSDSYKKIKEDAENSGAKIDDDVRVYNSTIDAINGGENSLGPIYDIENDKVYTDSSKAPQDLAHELGHRHFYKDKDAGKVGRIAHKAYDLTGGGVGNTLIGAGGGIISGIRSGKKKARKESEGKKEGVWNKMKPYVIPAAINSPMLISEGAATLHGIKNMKKHGATNSELKKARKDLGLSYGTYLSMAAANAGIGRLSKEIAYQKEKKKLKKEKKKD